MVSQMSSGFPQAVLVVRYLPLASVPTNPGERERKVLLTIKK